MMETRLILLTVMWLSGSTKSPPPSHSAPGSPSQATGGGREADTRPAQKHEHLENMKTELQKALASLAPSICIKTTWEHDPYCRDIRQDCEGMEDEDPDDWQAWQSEVSASAIINGEEVSASAYLGGTWEKATDHPETSNPDISGYEPDMTVGALTGLLQLAPSLSDEITAAVAHIESLS